MVNSIAESREFTILRTSRIFKTSKKRRANTAPSSRIVVARRSVHSLLQRLALWTSVAKNSYQLFCASSPNEHRSSFHNPKVVKTLLAPATKKDIFAVLLTGLELNGLNNYLYLLFSFFIKKYFSLDDVGDFWYNMYDKINMGGSQNAI